MKYLYRIEHVATKQGPYTHICAGGLSWIDHKKECTVKSHPTPMEEITLAPHWHMGYKVACSSRSQLRSWFNKKERKALKRLGFRVKVIPVSHCQIVRHGDRQSIFILKDNKENVCSK